MSGMGALIFLGTLVVLGLSIWGLFNRGRSVFCAVAGVLLMPGAGLGAWHAWGESRSLLGTGIYLVLVLVGLVALLRQVLPRKP